MVAHVDPRDLKPGQMVDGWRIVRRIGSGGYAVVYEVEKDGQRFALKVACHREQSGDPRQTDARAKREVACLQQLTHRYIIRIWGYGRWPDPRSGFLYIVLDFVDGYTLGEWKERTFPTPHEVAVLFLKLFEALEHMHERGVFHRDLSLRNIMVTKEGEPVIIDFGAADYAAAEELTDAPLPPGTPRNRSPEAQRFWNANRLNPEARYPFKATDDIFALGADLYDVLTVPTPERSLVRPPLGDAVPPPSPFKVTQGRVPEVLSGYALMLIKSEPEDRPATAKDARRPLEEFAHYEGPEWRSTPIHPIAAQLPPEPGEAVPMSSAAGGAALSGARRRWLYPVFVGSLVLVVLTATVAALLLNAEAPPKSSPVARSAPADQPPPSSVLAEKPTSRPAQLPSPLPTLPTQEETSPVKQPENSPTLTNGVPNPPQVQKARGQRVLSKVQRCALLVATLEWFQAGCSGMQTRPDPEACPEEAIRAMEQELGWDVLAGQGGTQPFILVDVTKGSVDEAREEPLAVFRDGPVTGALIEAIGKAPAGTRLDGHLWTTGERIYGRYLRAHLPGGRTVPICVELKSGLALGIDKQEGSKPGAPLGNKASSSIAINRWR